MKKLLLVATLFVASFTTKTFANDVIITPVVRLSFQQTFFDATGVQWSVVGHLYKAHFSMDGEQMSAFFSMDDGMLVATSRYITPTQLPRALQHSLKSYTASFTLIELFELQGDAGTDYYATVKKEHQTLVLKAAAKKWNVYKKS